MPVYVGTTQLTASYLGSTALSKLYLGTTQIYPAGAPAFSAIGAGNGLSAASISDTITAAAGDTVFACFTTSDSTKSISSVTCGGTGMTSVGALNHNNVASSTTGVTWLYKLAGVSAGSKTVTVNLSSACEITLCAVSYSGVTTIGAATTVFGSSTVASQSVTPASGARALQIHGGFCGAAFGSIAVAGSTNRYNALGYNTRNPLAINDTTTNPTTFTMTCNSMTWASIWVPLTS